MKHNIVLFKTNITIVLLASQMVQARDFVKQPHIGDVFVIALENHNFTQPDPTASPGEILGNPAAPFINSLITPGSSNAVYVSYAIEYHNAGIGVHPSEPNYVWAESGSDFGFHSDADPNMANGNKFYDNSTQLISSLNANGSTEVFWHQNQTPHLAGQLSAAGIPWKNYQEDVESSLSPTNSASGADGPLNPYNGTTQYNYAVKHNPMAFFNDSALENVYPLAQLFQDLSDNTVGRYNWITPDQYNDGHSPLNDGFTYQGIHYAGDQSAVAASDNFLSEVLPRIMASRSYRENGVIILRWDETEGGDTADYTIPEIVISHLAKGNAYASCVTFSHSSDLKTWEEVFGLPLVNNPIPMGETNYDGTFNNVGIANDLSDLFLPEIIPTISFSVTPGKFEIDGRTQNISQSVRVTNSGESLVSGPVWLVLDNLSTNATLLNPDGTTAVLAPLGSPAVKINFGSFESRSFLPHQTAVANLEFLNPSGDPITYATRVLNVVPAP